MHRLSRRSALLLALGVFAAASGSAAAGTIADYRLIVLDGASLKWGEPVDGTPATVTYAVVDDTRRFPDARNCGGLSPLAALLAANRIDRAAVRHRVEGRFRRLAAVADIEFVPAPSARRRSLSGRKANRAGVPSPMSTMTSGQGRFQRRSGAAAPHAPGAHLPQPGTALEDRLRRRSRRYDLRYTLQHEIGHAIGLDHPSFRGRNDGLPLYSSNSGTPQAGDIRGAVALYGPRTGATVAVAEPGKAPLPVASRITELAISAPGEKDRPRLQSAVPPGNQEGDRRPDDREAAPSGRDCLGVPLRYQKRNSLGSHP